MRPTPALRNKTGSSVSATAPAPQAGRSLMPGAVVPAVHQDWPHVSGARGGGAVDEGEHGEGVLGDAHVRPLSVVILDNNALVQLPFRVPLLTLEQETRQLRTR